jgi:hypothetical protein
MNSNFGWEKGFDHNFLLSRIAACRSIHKGKCSFNASEYAFWKTVLNSSIRASKAVGSLKARCVEKAMSDPTVTLRDADAFLQRCELAFHEIEKLGKQRYVMLCHITYTGPKLFSAVTLANGSQVSWQPKNTNRFFSTAIKSRHSLSDLLRSRDVPTDVTRMTALLVQVDAYGIEHANEQAADALDQIRGLLNLIANSNRRINPFFRLSRPHAVNRFRSGPYRTLHKSDGSLAVEMFWYEPRWHHEHETVKFTGTPENPRKAIYKWWRKIRDNPLHANIVDGLLRYCRALDQHDSEAALLGLWGTIENLTGTQNLKYDITVARAVNFFKEDVESRQIAQHVRLRRNATVHAARSLNTDETDAVILQAEKLVSQALFFYIKRGKIFANKEDLFEFLDLTGKKPALIKRQKMIDRFIALKGL